MNQIVSKSVLFCLIALTMPACVVAGEDGASTGVFKDAIAVWHMGSPEGAGLKVHGKVRVGVELRNAEKQASLDRGGDGKAAEFDGGHLVVGDADQLASLKGCRTMTLCMRLRDSNGSGGWDSPLLAINNPADKFANILYGTHLDVSAIGAREMARIDGGGQLEFLWRTNRKGIGPANWNYTPDFTKGVLRVGVPVDLIDPAVWHDVVVRFTGPHLEMFVDGVLVDEEWPYGAIDGLDASLLIGAGFENGQAKAGFRGLVDHVAIWNRALADDEIAVLGGGREHVARRDVEILGEETAEMQYWRPRGYNTFVGDVMLFFHDGRLHVYYLFDRRHHRSKWGVGAHQFAHMSTKDLVHWEHHPMALPITDQTECSLGTGCFVFRNGTYYLYYIQHAKRLALADAPYPGDNIFMATSTDGIHFTKHPKPVVLMNYQGGDINPHVITCEGGNKYIMTVSGWKVCISENLTDWVDADLPQLRSIKWICADDFKLKDWRYFTGCGNYVMTQRPIEDTREWVQPRSQALRDSLGVPVVSEFTGNRCIYAGFAGGSYAQELVFRELVQEKDGTLGMMWPAEMVPKSGEAIKRQWQPLKGDASITSSGVRLAAKERFACALLADVPQNVRITLRASPRQGVQSFGLCVRGFDAYEGGCELRFEPARQHVQYRNGPGMDNVPGLDEECTIDVIVKDDLVDACIGNRRTLLCRNSAKGDRLFLFAVNGEVTFDNIQVRPLLAHRMQRQVNAVKRRTAQSLCTLTRDSRDRSRAKSGVVGPVVRQCVDSGNLYE